MNKNTNYTVGDLPFCIGASEKPTNPRGLPDVLPLTLEINYKLGRLEQIESEKLNQFLKKSYKIGMEMGTPSDNTDLGRPYVNDFLQFINFHTLSNGRILEIGAGTGFISKCLSELGWDVVSIEPGKGYKKYWEKYGIQVINDFFPSDKIKGDFDAIVFYTVLEHIKDTDSFLKQLSKILRPNGQIFLAVPDCSEEIKACDPSILLHEHFHYFTKNSLYNTLIASGFEPIVEPSNYGRSLFARAVYSKSSCPTIELNEDIEQLEHFLIGIKKFRNKVNNIIANWLNKGRVGIYCPGRVLNLISTEYKIDFYDDDNNLHNKYYPPFDSRIQNREQLLSNPPETLLIASRTFGVKLREDLIQSGLQSRIFLLNEFTKL